MIRLLVWVAILCTLLTTPQAPPFGHGQFEVISDQARHVFEQFPGR
jgi:hypothetical protein